MTSALVDPCRGERHGEPDAPVDRLGDWIETFSGERWWPHDPRVEDVRKYDLPALCQVIRWGGHCRSKRDDGHPYRMFAPYSVGQHSVHVAEVVTMLGGSPFERKCALLHDAHEMYPPGDVLAPVFFHDCEATRALRAMGNAAKVALRTAFGLPLDMPEIVRRADMIMLATERRDIMIYRSWQRPLPDPAAFSIEVWSPDYAWDRLKAELDDLWEVVA